MARKTDILKKYYSYSTYRKNDFMERSINFFKRHNFFGRMNKDIDCLKLAEMVLDRFQPSQILDSDPFLGRSRRTLLNAIVFFLYYERDPDDLDFIRVINLLRSALEQTQMGWVKTHLDCLYEPDNGSKRQHTGHRELELFKMTPPHAAHLVIDSVLQNLKTPIECKNLFSEVLAEM